MPWLSLPFLSFQQSLCHTTKYLTVDTTINPKTCRTSDLKVRTGALSECQNSAAEGFVEPTTLQRRHTGCLITGT